MNEKRENKKEETKKWIKEHSDEIVMSGVGLCGLAAGLLIGTDISKKSHIRKLQMAVGRANMENDKKVKDLLKMICPEVDRYYVVKRTGDFKGSTLAEYKDLKELVNEIMKAIKED